MKRPTVSHIMSLCNHDIPAGQVLLSVEFDLRGVAHLSMGME